MIFTSEQIKTRLKSIWRDLQFIWPTNPNWGLVSDEWLSMLKENCSVRHYVFIPGIWECENYAHQFKANVEKYQYELYQSGIFCPSWRWAVGESIGIQSDIFGNATVHGMNIIITETGVLVYEPQEDTYLENNYEYVPFFIKF